MKMLKIRREQMDALNLVAVGGFRERMHTEMAAKFPVVLAELRQDGFRATIDAAIERARRYGCELESEIERFLLILFELGVDFEQRPGCKWAQDILDNVALSGKVKISLIEELL